MIKFEYFEYCIFCNLPIGNTRGQEHIIPRNIYGFWTSYDVCNECMRYFGENVDNLPLNSLIIEEALNALGLRMLDSKVKFTGEDIFTKEKFTMYEKNKTYIINVKEKENYISTPNDFIPYHLEKIFRERGVDEKEINDKVKNTLKSYNEIADNEILKIEDVKISLRKGSIERKEPVSESNKILTPLIAKIIVISLNYILSKNDIKKITNFENIKEHASYSKPLPREYILYYSPEQIAKKYLKWHRIILFINEKFIQVCIRLFGYLRWFFISSLEEPLTLTTPKNENISEAGFVISFENALELDFVYKLSSSEEKHIVNLIP